jgi:hypothetical protein
MSPINKGTAPTFARKIQILQKFNDKFQNLANAMLEFG